MYIVDASTKNSIWDEIFVVLNIAVNFTSTFLSWFYLAKVY